jgi:hypothetical protein
MRPVFRKDLLDGGADGVGQRHVGLHGEGPVGQRGRHLPGSFQVQIDDGNGGAGGCQAGGDGLADAGGRAGDDGGLALQAEHDGNGWSGHGRIVRTAPETVKTRENTGLDSTKDGDV